MTIKNSKYLTLFVCFHHALAKLGILCYLQTTNISIKLPVSAARGHLGHVFKTFVNGKNTLKGPNVTNDPNCIKNLQRCENIKKISS
jgi:hypothetical protein